MTLHIGVGHPERINTHLHARLTKDQRGGDKLENLINAAVGHGIAADGNTGAVNHQIFTIIAMRAIVGIGKTNVDGLIKTAVWLELIALNAVKPFRTFKIALTAFRA